mmetsp:Transcript_21469/g.42177  ORF Transcript_21469/g.42177 Transcript_21469/m.42177 type:complete len:81 (-) Transcript_21469:2323-2565(-)
MIHDMSLSIITELFSSFLFFFFRSLFSKTIVIIRGVQVPPCAYIRREELRRDEKLKLRKKKFGGLNETGRKPHCDLSRQG